MDKCSAADFDVEIHGDRRMMARVPAALPVPFVDRAWRDATLMRRARVLAAVVGALIVSLHGGPGSSPAASPSIDPPHSIARVSAVTADLDGDGILDRVVERDGHSDRTVRIDLSSRPAPEFAHARADIVAVAAADLDNDGHPDLLASSADGTLTVWRNRGDGSFALLAPGHHPDTTATGGGSLTGHSPPNRLLALQRNPTPDGTISRILVSVLPARDSAPNRSTPGLSSAIPCTASPRAPPLTVL
jgi:VCBS repeat protein